MRSYLCSCILLLFYLLFVCSACRWQESESLYVSVPDKSITPIKYFKQHEIKMKCGRTVKFTLPAEFSNNYSMVGFGRFSGEDLVEQYHLGISNAIRTYFSITSYKLDSPYTDEKQMDMIFIRANIENYIMGGIGEVPIVEKKADNTGQIFYFIYKFGLNNSTDDSNVIHSICYCATVYHDTEYCAELGFNTDIDHFDFPTYRKIIESVQIR